MGQCGGWRHLPNLPIQRTRTPGVVDVGGGGLRTGLCVTVSGMFDKLGVGTLGCLLPL